MKDKKQAILEDKNGKGEGLTGFPWRTGFIVEQGVIKQHWNEVWLGKSDCIIL